MRTYNHIIIAMTFLVSLLGAERLTAQSCTPTNYNTNNLPLSVTVYSTCPNRWNLTMTAPDHGDIYCDVITGCYQYILLKNGLSVQQYFSYDATGGFAVPANDNASYAIGIISKRIVSSCWHIYSDYSESFFNRPFCAQDATYSNKSSGAGTLIPVTKANDFILTQSDVTVNSGTDVKFYSNSITLEPGFLAESGSDFMTQIQSCTVISACPVKISSTTEYEVIGNATSVSEQHQTRVNVFPNPSSGIFQITTGEYEGMIGKVEVFNSIGQRIVVLEDDHVIQANYSMNNSVLGGIYTIKISSQNRSIMKKIVVSGTGQ